MIIDCIADLHGHFPKLEGGDLLIVAGDLTARHTPQEFDKFNDWLFNQDYNFKVVIAGNHDTLLQDYPYRIHWEIDNYDFRKTPNSRPFGGRLSSANVYLCDSGTEMEYLESVTHDPDPETGVVLTMYKKKNLKIWGSPWTLTFPGINPSCAAFTGTEAELAAKFALIPDDIDILVTHGPSFGNLDITKRGESVGSVSLWMKILEVRPKIHVFGHVHESYGDVTHYNGLRMINCSRVNELYEPVNKPVRIIL